MNQRIYTTQGFSAIELLITLFVAAVFLAAGYQLYTVILTDSGNARAESSAGNVAYDYIRQYSSSATNPCTELNPITDEAVSITGVVDSTASVIITCPQTNALTLSKVETVISYTFAGDAKEVRHATYVDASKRSLSEVSDGLVGWWKFNNGNIESDIGDYGESNGLLISNVEGQNGQPNSALRFALYYAGVPHVRVPTDTGFAKPTDGFSVSGWFYNTTINSSEQTIMSTSHNGGWGVYAGSPSCPANLRFDVYINGSIRSLCTTSSNTVPNAWVFFAAVYDGSQMRLYVDDEGPAGLSASGTMSWGPSTTPLCIASEVTATSCDSNPFIGNLDDIRYYSRPLSNAEIVQLYTRGAQ